MQSPLKIFVILIVVAVGAYFLTLQFKTNSSDTTDTVAETTEDEQNTAMSENTLRALLLSGKSLTCTFSHTDESGTQDGTAYIDNDRVRGSFSMSGTDGTSYQAEVLMDGEWVYTWGGPYGETEGMKMKVEEETETTGEEGDTKQETWDLDQQGTFDCRAWRVDNDMFTPPSNITFKEFSLQAEMQNALDASDMNLDCSVCEHAPGEEAQAQCRAALGC